MLLMWSAHLFLLDAGYRQKGVYQNRNFIKRTLHAHSSCPLQDIDVGGWTLDVLSSTPYTGEVQVKPLYGGLLNGKLV